MVARERQIFISGKAVKSRIFNEERSSSKNHYIKIMGYLLTTGKKNSDEEFCICVENSAG